MHQHLGKITIAGVAALLVFAFTSRYSLPPFEQPLGLISSWPGHCSNPARISHMSSLYTLPEESFGDPKVTLPRSDFVVIGDVANVYPTKYASLTGDRPSNLKIFEAEQADYYRVQTIYRIVVVSASKVLSGTEMTGIVFPVLGGYSDDCSGHVFQMSLIVFDGGLHSKGLAAVRGSDRSDNSDQCAPWNVAASRIANELSTNGEIYESGSLEMWYSYDSNSKTVLSPHGSILPLKVKAFESEARSIIEDAKH